ncbi:hypothetical protein GOBAR_DD24279 [Gossypium barbadense]|nr:hypothetical protein GOBAR_DD24279 [Gossypium barbadense]
MVLSPSSKPGASSGIMLGAVTLPTVMLSKLIQLSRAFSLQQIEIGGEALLLTSGLVLYFGDMLACTISKVCRLLVSPELVSIRYGIKRSEIGIIIQGVLLGLLIFSAVFKFVIHLWEYFWRADNSESRQNKEIRRSLIFFASLGFNMIVVAPSWMMIVLDFDDIPVCFIGTIKTTVTMYLLVGFDICICLEVWRIWPLGQLVHQFMSAFTDHRDSDILIVSHFSLLLGCALPIWMSSGFNDRPLIPFAGILSLGIGDTMASMVGHKYGVLRWSKTGKKTIEGTAAGIVSVLAACSHWFPLLIAVTTSGLLEAYTAQLDNAFIPLVFYSLLCL